MKGPWRLGFQVDDTLFELPHSPQGEFESCGSADQAFKGIDRGRGQARRRDERKHQGYVRGYAGSSAWIELQPQVSHHLTDPKRRHEYNAFEQMRIPDAR